MALQLFVKRKAKDTRLYKIMNQPVNTQPIGQIILRCVSIPICFSVNENQGKARCMFTKERNVKISLRRESTVSSMFDYLFTNLHDTVKQTTLGTTSLLLLFSDDKEKGQIFPSANEIPDSLLLPLGLSLHHDARLATHNPNFDTSYISLQTEPLNIRPCGT